MEEYWREMPKEPVLQLKILLLAIILMVVADSNDAACQQVSRDVWLSFEISSNVKEPGGIHPKIRQQGWSWLFSRCARLYELGYRQFLFHRPLGENNTGELMDFASPVVLRNDRLLQELLAEFQPALSKFTKEYDCKIILYFGSLKGPSTSDAIKSRDFKDWFRLTNGTLSPFIDNPRIEIAFDHSSTFRENSVNWRYVELTNEWLKLTNRRVWLEAVPKLENKYQHGYHSIVTESSFLEKSQKNFWYLDPPKTIRWLNRGSWFNAKSWQDQGISGFVKDCRAKKYQLCIDWTFLEF